MNGKPEKWCGRCGGTGLSCGKPCRCLTLAAPIPAPVKCKGCGGKYPPAQPGAIIHHGSVGWSCNGTQMTSTVTGKVIKKRP